MNKKSLLVAAGMGAGTLYFLDPRLGRRRRAYVSEKAARYSREIAEAAGAFAKDVRNHFTGIASSLRPKWFKKSGDQVLQDQIRAEAAARWVSHPRSKRAISPRGSRSFLRQT